MTSYPNRSASDSDAQHALYNPLVFDLGESISGLEITRSIPFSPARRIVCLDTTSCFAEIGQVMPELFRTIAKSLEDLNTGIHGHLFAAPDDFLVLQANYWGMADPRPLAHHLLDLNASIWDFQTGVPLLGARYDGVSFVREGESMLEAAVNLFDQAGGTTLVASSVTPRLARLLHADDSELMEVGRSCDLMNHKNSAMRILKHHGVRVPRTIVCDSAVSNANGGVNLDRLDQDRRYMLKADGSSGGIGIFTGNDQGYDLESLRRLIDGLTREGRLPTRFQIQEHVPGKSMGALALLNGPHVPRVVSIHEQNARRGKFEAAHWNQDLESQLMYQLQDVYSHLAAMDGIHLRGPVGIDFLAQGKDIVVVEVNARSTGTAPMAWLRAKIDGRVEVECIHLLINVRLSMSELTGNTLYRSIQTIVGDSEVRSRCSGPPMILPQGLDPFRPCKLMFANDPEGFLRRKFREHFPSSFEFEESNEVWYAG